MYVSNVLSCGDGAFTHFGDYEEENSKEEKSKEEEFDRDVTGTVSGSIQTR